MRWVITWRPHLAMLVLAACGDPAAHVHLVPIGGPCGTPAGATEIKITAFTPSGERAQSIAPSETVDIASFPSTTEQIGVEVIVGGGKVGAHGKTGPLAFGSLADRADIPIFMAPPDGFCEVGSLHEPRAQPLVARAGDGVLVIGGSGPTGPLSTAEYYDPKSATFFSVPVPDVLHDDAQGFAGTALATLPDGKVAVIGGPHSAFAVFDPASVFDDKIPAFDDPVLIDPRAFHAAIAVGDTDVLVIGGCSAVAGGACSGVARRQSLVYHLAKLSEPDPKVQLPAMSSRIGARVFDIGVQLDGVHRYVLAGGSGDPGAGDAFAIDDELTTPLAGLHAQAAPLDGGAVLTAFAPDAAPADGAASVIAPGGPAVAVHAATPLAHARLVALEDGRIAAIGGDATISEYDPMLDRWSRVTPAGDPTGTLDSPALVRLPDGSVLAVGGAVSDKAFVFRPSLFGPQSGSVTALLTSDTSQAIVTPSDPQAVTRETTPPAWVLTSPGDALTARGLVGGPRIVTGSVRAAVHVRAGGVALIAQQTAPGEAIVAELAPDQPARLVRLGGGTEQPLCTGNPVDAFDPQSPVTLALALTDHDATVTRTEQGATATLLQCNLSATARGAWGIAALGTDAHVAVDTVTVAR